MKRTLDFEMECDHVHSTRLHNNSAPRMRQYCYSVISAILILTMSGPLFAADRLELDNTSIQGSRELPKVLYIVPWKKSRVGTLAGVSEHASFEQSMTSLDREVFLQELKYYNILNGPELLSKK